MKWLIEHEGNHAKYVDGLLIMLILFLVSALFSANRLLFMCAGIWATYYFINRFYEKKLATALDIKNPKRKIRLFPGQEGSLGFSIENSSIFPFVNGKFRFSHGRSIKTPYSSKEDITIPVPLLGKGRTVIDIPLTAEQRGTTRIYGIHYSFSHLFLFDKTLLNYRAFYHTECIVFPQVLPVDGVEAIMNHVPGEQKVRASLFEDRQSYLGTRDYQLSDPFYLINWKASAKSPKLQTHIFEKAADLSFSFVIGLRGTHNGAQDLEKLLSYTAYLCQQANAKGYAYDLSINIRTSGTVPYLHLPEGEGNTHYFNALEMLAKVERIAPLLPLEPFLYRVGQQFTKPKVIIFVGGHSTDFHTVINKWKIRQQSIYCIEENSEGASIMPFRKEAKRFG